MLKIGRCVFGFIFLLCLMFFVSNIGTFDVKMNPPPLPAFLLFIPPVILSLLLLQLFVHWIRYRNHTIAKFLTIEFLVVIFSYLLLPTQIPSVYFFPTCVNLSAQLVLVLLILFEISHSRITKSFICFLCFIAILILMFGSQRRNIVISGIFVLLVGHNPFVIKISKLFFVYESPYYENVSDRGNSKPHVSSHVISSI